MSALNVMRSTSVVHIATDGLFISPDGAIAPWLAPKTYVAPHMPMALATRGKSEAASILGMSIVKLFSEFDAVIDGLERVFPQLLTAPRQSTGEPDPLLMQTQLIVAGWSTARSQAEAYFIWAGEESGLADYPCAPFKLTPVDVGMCSPSLHVDLDIDLDLHHIERDMIAIIEAQRRELPVIVGGFCQLTTLTEHAVTQRILRRWPVSPFERREAAAPLCEG